MASLPKPEPDLIRATCAAFDADEWNKLTEKAIRELWAAFPNNTEESHVLLKVVVLDKRYSTRILNIETDAFVRHIVGIDGLDALLRAGSLDAVERIAHCPGLQRKYSFATKFCSWHNPVAYPIYDGYVDDCLWGYRQQDQFTAFQRQHLLDYSKFHEVVSAFRDHYQLSPSEFTFKQLDKFLWTQGDSMQTRAAVTAP